MSSEQHHRPPRRLAGPLRRRGGLLLAVLVCGAMVYGVVAAFGFSTEAARVPLVIGIPAALAALVLVVKELVSPSGTATDELSVPRSAPGVPPGTPGNLESPADPGAPADPGTPADLESPSPPDDERQAGSPGAAPAAARISTAAAWAWVLGLAAMFLLLGLLVTIPVFMVAFMRSYGREPWPTVLITTGIVFGLTYLFFVQVLSVQVFEGWARIWLGW